MGIRETQIIGLTNKAKEFLQKKCRKVADIVCQHCGKTVTLKMDKRVYDDKTGVALGMFDDGPVLYEYKLNNGLVAKEVVQHCEWSSGPVMFLCLKVNKKDMFRWTKKEIKSCL